MLAMKPFLSLSLIVVLIALLRYGNASTKTFIVTGAKNGIGFAAVKKLLETRDDCKVFFACRSKEKALRAIRSLPSNCIDRAEFRFLDVSDLASVRQFAKEWGETSIDCLALNAGVQLTGNRIPSYSKQNYELTIATNHIGQFLLLQLLLPNVKASNTGRVVFTASGGTFKK
jgi:NAD(P)-dependent dehydrogenase (short-subunit alcohol dehydrogenase family)